MYNSIMLKSNCKIGDIVHFTCNGRGRGGHYHVTVIVTKVNSKNALLTEQPRSYSPGTRWNWPISDLTSAEDYEAQCARSREAYKQGGIEGLVKAWIE